MNKKKILVDMSATIIHNGHIRLLKKAKKLYNSSTKEETKSNILKDALMIENFNLEYFEILDISELSGFLVEEKEIRAFIACKVGKIRLIDNIKI